MKTTSIFLVLSACLLKIGSSYTLVDCDDLSENICTLFSGDGRVCGCTDANTSDCTQGYYDYHGVCLDQVYSDLCTAFCRSNGHICKGDSPPFCNEYENGDSS
ncbi:hypothetical protein K501DRAFT_266444 [Backusella circina FSU 941]|nr:hypothetical protein K501DRAFT_266444 [Backusella circina FSU 941]